MEKRHCLWLLMLVLAACGGEEPAPEADDHFVGADTMILTTDSDEWHVREIAEALYYHEAVEASIPEPYRLPCKDEARVLRQLSYGDGKYRYVTSDGYTFGTPSASKTKYSVLGLWRRPTEIHIKW